MQNKQILKHIKTQRDLFLKQFISQIDTGDICYLSGKGTFAKLTRLFSISNYAAHICLRWPFMLIDHLKQGLLDIPVAENQLHNDLATTLESVNDKTTLMYKLRLFRHSNMLRILWRDANNIADIEETMKALSLLAECCIDKTLDWLYQHLTKKFGFPVSKNNIQQKMVVLGMGKLGGHELNFSSDVDLIFCYPQTGKTQGGPAETDNHHFFNQAGQSLIKILNDVTKDGFVYRVDTRLRPYGNSGILVWSFDAMEQYYQSQGRDWERYALVKARPVAGDISQGIQLLDRLKPFIYRRYLDFSTIESLRNIKTLMRQKELKKGMHNDIKRGSGGIREIEFIAQSFQLIYGGKNKQLQKSSLLVTLHKLAQYKFLPQNDTDKLRKIYLFFRRIEHLIQAKDDQQTHLLPTDEWRQIILASGMNYPDKEQLIDMINEYRFFVKKLFGSLIQTADQDANSEEWILLWENKMSGSEAIALLTDKGFKQAEVAFEKISLLRNSKILKNVSRKSLERINRFMIKLLHECHQQSSPDQALQQSLPVVEKILRRTAYLVLLIERPPALQHLVKLCSESLWITQKIARNPVLIDEFLNPGDLYNPLPVDSLQEELSKQLAHLGTAKIEEKLASLCYFKIAHLLKCTVAQTNGYMTLTQTNHYMTSIAEVIIREVINISWDLLVSRHGWPGKCKPQDDQPFIVLGYGKLGSMEIGPASDLDLVFIHNTDIQDNSSGAVSIDNQTFFYRFAQKMIGCLFMQTPLGKLYEIDVRLRPSGNAGLLVSSFKAFTSYQKKEAWLWECQALIKARVIAGKNEQLKTAFEKLRCDVLQQKRDTVPLQEAFKKMRNKMKVLDKSTKQIFDMKYANGGIINIEFIVQYLTLMHANKHPSLVEQPTDNISMLKKFTQKKLLDKKYSDFLQSGYLVFMQVCHNRARQYQDNVAGQNLFIKERNYVISTWNYLLNDDLPLLTPSLP